MGYLHCCSSLHKSKSFKLQPEKGYLLCEIEYLEECPVCGHTILQVTRIDYENKISTCRKINVKARKFMKKIQPLIICEIKSYFNNFSSGGKFYLNYNEFGKKKKCYSNLSTLKIGLFENSNFYNTSKIK